MLFTELKNGKEYTAVHVLPGARGDSVIAKELKAILLGLQNMNFSSEIEIYTGSKWLVTALNEWVAKWQQDNWVKANGKSVANKELWQQITEELEKHTYKVKLKD